MQLLKNELQALKGNKSLVKSQVDGKGDELAGMERAKWEGMVSSVSSFRDSIAKQMFDLFVKSVGEGEKKKSNSLIIFIENWKCMDMERLLPYCKSYFQAR